jgi:hypothetical protein
MKSTAVVLVANQNAAVCGHIGDSRLYHFRASHIAHQTQDHSVPGALAASGDIGLQQIRFHEDRNRLLRSLGGESESSPTIETRNLTQGDAFLLCSDGFWEYVNELEMEVDCAKASTPAEWMSFMTARLLQRAQPENDNYTGMGVFFQSPSAPPPFLPPPRTKARPIRKNANYLSIAAIVLLSFSLLVFVGLAIGAKLHWSPLGSGKKTPVGNASVSPNANAGAGPSPIGVPLTDSHSPKANTGGGPSQTSATELVPLASEADDLQLEFEIENADPERTINLQPEIYKVRTSSAFDPKAISVTGAGKNRTCLFVEGDFERVFAAGSTFSKLSLICKKKVDANIRPDAEQFRPGKTPKQCAAAKSPPGARP